MKMKLKRHTLLDISDSGREAILTELAEDIPDGAAHWEQYAQVILPTVTGARVPGIVRREEGVLTRGCVPIGFSSPTGGDEGRLRIAAFVRQEDIVSTTEPYELLTLGAVSPHNACTTALDVAERQSRELGLDLGVWGSAALELYTGLPYTHQDSDLDLLVAVAPREKLSQLLAEIELIEARFALRIDIELELANGYGVNLKELFRHGRTVLGKSLIDVTLFLRSQVLAMLPADRD